MPYASDDILAEIDRQDSAPINLVPAAAVSDRRLNYQPSDIEAELARQEPTDIESELARQDAIGQQPRFQETIGPDTRSTARRALDYIGRKLEPITPKNMAFPRLNAGDIASVNLSTLLPGVDPETGQSFHSTATAEDNAKAPFIAKVAAGAERAGAGLVEGAVPFLIGGPATGGVPLVSRLISLGFAGKMLSEVPDAYKAFTQAVKAGDVQGATEALLGGSLGLVFSGLALKHGAGPGLAKESPMVNRLLTKRVTEEFTPDELKQVMARVNSDDAETQAAKDAERPRDATIPVATPAERELSRLITGEPQTVKKGATVTTVEPKIKSEFWRKYLGLDESGKIVETELTKQDQEEQNAAHNVEFESRVQKQLEGTVGERKKEQGSGTRDQLPSPAGQPAEGQITALEKEPVAPKAEVKPTPTFRGTSLSEWQSIQNGEAFGTTIGQDKDPVTGQLVGGQKVDSTWAIEDREYAARYASRIPAGVLIEFKPSARQKMRPVIADAGPGVAPDNRLNGKGLTIDDVAKVYDANGKIIYDAESPITLTTIIDPQVAPVQEVPTSEIKLSTDVPQFKRKANPKTGVVEGKEIKGKEYIRLPTLPVILWRRLNGSLEIITGRHRFAYAKSIKEKTIPAQIVDEAKGFTKDMALTFDAEANIRDNQGDLEDFAHYFKHTPDLTRDEADARGLLRDVKGKEAWDLARVASDDLYSLWQGGQIGKSEALTIARSSPDASLQRVGIQQALKGRSQEQIANDMQAARVLTAGAQPEQVDLFGADDSAIRQMEQMSKAASGHQRELADQIAAISGASKRPEVAKRLGVDIKDPVSVAAKLGELRLAKAQWDNWSSNADLVKMLRQEVAPKPDLTLAKPESVEEQKVRVAQEETARQANAAKAKIAEAAAKPLVGTTGDLGQGDLLNAPQDLFAPPTPKPEVKAPLFNAEEQKRVDEILAQLQKKLGRTSMGVDPEFFTLGSELAYRYIRAGVRKFADFAANMLKALGAKAKSYLLSWYSNAKTKLKDIAHELDDEATAQRIYSEQFGGGDVAGPDVSPEVRRSSNWRQRPGVRIARAELIPVPKQYVGADRYATRSGFTLDAEQVRGINLILDRFSQNATGAFLLADGPGFGKTAQELAVADQYRTLGLGKRILIVTQNQQIAETRFKGDAQRMGIDLSGITLTTFTSLKNLTEHNWDLIVYDESHGLKNGDAQKSTAAARLTAKHELFATATPMDRPTGAAYFLSKITGEDYLTIANKLGYTFQQREEPFTHKIIEVPVTLPKFTWQDVWNNIMAYRDASVSGGAMIRREYPFFGKVVTQLVSMPSGAQTEQVAITKHYDDLIERAKSPTARRNYAGQKTLTLSRWSEQQKLAYAVKVTLEHLQKGGQVIIVAETDKKQSFPKYIKGAVRSEDDERGREVWKVDGAITRLKSMLAAAGITDIADIHDPSSNNIASEVQRFQAGKARVALATPQSGGTGIDLDDVSGDAPRLMVALSKNFAGDAFEQLVGRISRKNTASEAEARFLTLEGSYADERRDDVLAKKVRTLRAIQGGEEIDKAGGFEAEKGKQAALIARSGPLYPELTGDVGLLHERATGTPNFPGWEQSEIAPGRRDVGERTPVQPIAVEPAPAASAVQPAAAPPRPVRRSTPFGKLKPGDLIEYNGVPVVVESLKPDPLLEHKRQLRVHLPDDPSKWGEVTIDARQPISVAEPWGRQGMLTARPPRFFGQDLSAVGPEELRKLVNSPEAGLTPPARRLVNALLDMPVGKTLEGLEVRIKDTLEEGWQGSWVQGLIEMGRNADALTLPHELAHHMFSLLPADLANEIERLRAASIDALLKEPGNASVISYLEQLRDNPTEGAQDYASRKVPVALDAEVYPYSNTTEFFAHTFSEHFEKKVGSKVEGFWDKVRAIWRQFIDAIKRGLKLRRSQTEIFDDILAGRFDITARDSIEAVADMAKQASIGPDEAADMDLRNAAETVREAGQGVPTKIFGKTYYTPAREQITEQSTEEGATYAKAIFDAAKLPVERQLLIDPKGGKRLVWLSPPQGRDTTTEWRAVLEQAKKEFATQFESPKARDLLGNLLNSIRRNYVRGSQSSMAEAQPGVRLELLALAQSDASARGAALQALAGHQEDLQVVGANLDVALGRIWSDAFGGDEIRRLMDELESARQRGDDLQNALDDALKTRPKAMRKELASHTVLGKKLLDLVLGGPGEPWTILREIAKTRKWAVPTDEDIARVKKWVEEWQRLETLTPAEAARFPTQEERDAYLRDHKLPLTEPRRLKLRHDVDTKWTRFTKPISPYTSTGRINMISAAGDFVSANLLLKAGFATRQSVDVAAQWLFQAPTSAIASAVQSHLIEVGEGRRSKIDPVLWTDIGDSITKAYRQQVKSLPATLNAASAALRGSAQAPAIGRVMGRVSVFDRAMQKAEEMQAAGKTTEATLLKLFTYMKLGYTVAQTFDRLQNVPAVEQWMRQEVVENLRAQGVDRAAANVKAEGVMGDQKAEIALALSQAEQELPAWGITDPKEIRAGAFRLVRARQYERMRQLGMPADDFEQMNQHRAETIAWNVREEGGFGGLVASNLQKLGRAAVTTAGEHPVAIPLAAPIIAMTRFSNAIGILLNRKLTWLGLGFWPGFFGVNDRNIDDKGVAHGGSPWFKYPEQRRERKIESAWGSSLISVALLLAAAGVIIVRRSWPKDKEERQLWDKMGWRPGQISIPVGENSHITFSMNTGPFVPMAPGLAAGGALHDLMEARDKQQAKLNAEAEKKGIPAGKIRPIDVSDMMAVAADAGWTSLTSGRTISGLGGSISEYGKFSPIKTAASTISAWTPTLPGLQELGRLFSGSVVDSKMAGLWDYLTPMPTSNSQVNFLGDKVGSANDVQRVVQILTGGNYPFPVSDKERQESEESYKTLFASGYRPPSINPNKGYAINGQYRPMNDKELSEYTQLRGTYFKEELQELGPTDDPKAVQSAYKRANARALEEIGVETPAATAGGASARTAVGAGRSAAGAGAGRGLGAPRASSVGHAPSLRPPAIAGARTRGVRLGRSRLGRGPSLRSGRSLRLRTRSGRSLRVRH